MICIEVSSYMCAHITNILIYFDLLSEQKGLGSKRGETSVRPESQGA